MSSFNRGDVVVLTQDLWMDEFHLRGTGVKLAKQISQLTFRGIEKTPRLFRKGDEFVFEFRRASSVCLSRKTTHGPSTTTHYRTDAAGLKHFQLAGQVHLPKSHPARPTGHVKDLQFVRLNKNHILEHFVHRESRRRLISYLNKHPDKVLLDRVEVESGSVFILEAIREGYVVLTLLGEDQIVSVDHFFVPQQEFEAFFDPVPFNP
jgi:hypothetical protein